MCNTNSIPQNQTEHKTIGDVINELATRPDIDIYILERALVKRCYPDDDQYHAVEVDGQLACDSPGREIERKRIAELLARVEKVLAREAR